MHVYGLSQLGCINESTSFLPWTRSLLVSTDLSEVFFERRSKDGITAWHTLNADSNTAISLRSLSSVAVFASCCTFTLSNFRWCASFKQLSNFFKNTAVDLMGQKLWMAGRLTCSHRIESAGAALQFSITHAASHAQTVAWMSLHAYALTQMKNTYCWLW